MCSYGGNRQRLCHQEDCQICFNKSFASHEKADCWDYERNDNVSPRRVSKKTDTKKYWFKCDACHHSFESIPYNISNGSWCPYCSSYKLCDDIDCQTCFNKSFASHKKAVYWDYDRNADDKKPRSVFNISGKKYWFKCDTCNHSFESTLSNISAGCWCPYCCSTSKLFCDDIDCQFCFDKSFASHEKANCWDYERNHNKDPRKVCNSSSKKYWFKCDTCNHSFETVLYSISAGSWCPHCSLPPQRLCDDIDCQTCFNKSFASHEKAVYWDDERNSNEEPRRVCNSSGKKYWFKCDTCNHSFESTLANISKGKWCPLCKNKTEKLVFKHLSELYGEDVVHQKKFNWCKNKTTNRYLPFDICIESKKVIIEIDGCQHFKQIANWQSYDKTRKRDIMKTKLANEHQYRLIRIVQKDVMNKNYDWLSSLIEEIEHGNSNSFISINDSIYDEHIELLK